MATAVYHVVTANGRNMVSYMYHNNKMKKKNLPTRFPMEKVKVIGEDDQNKGVKRIVSQRDLCSRYELTVTLPNF